MREQPLPGQAHEAPQEDPRAPRLQAARGWRHQAGRGRPESMGATGYGGQTGLGMGDRPCLYSARRRGLYRAGVMALDARRIIGGSMKARLAKKLGVDAVLLTVGRRPPEPVERIHSYPRAPLSNDVWKQFCQAYGCFPAGAAEGRITSMRR